MYFLSIIIRQLELEYNTLKVQLKMQTDQIDGLQRQLRGQHTSSSSLSNAAALADSPVVATANSNGNSFLIGKSEGPLQSGAATCSESFVKCCPRVP